MSHIPDGLLHAYLDGALDHLGEGESAEVRDHLEACAECRARLDAERELRETAGALLADADPGVPAMPSFEELRRRARDTAPVEAVPSPTPDPEVAEESSRGRSKGPSRHWGLAWAATILLSLGLGWAGRGVWSVQSASLDLASAPEAAETLAMEQRQESPGLASQPPAARLREDAEADAASTPPEGVLDRTEVAESEAVQMLAVAGEPQSPPLADPTQASSQARANIERSVPAEPLDVFGMRAASGAAQEARRRAVDERVLFDDAAPTPSAESADEIDGDTAREPLAVPNLAILSIQPDPGVPGQPGVRILQRLHQGDTLELRYFGLLGGSEARLGTSEGVKIPMKDLPNPPLEAGWNQVIMQRGSGWLVARAPMTQESLEFLLRLLN